MPVLSPTGYSTTAIMPNTLAGSAKDFRVAAAGERIVPGVPTGAMPAPPPVPKFLADGGAWSTTRDIRKHQRERRVIIKVPPKYLVNDTRGFNNELGELGGIIFPYTPSISYGVKADWSEIKPLHSNFNIPFYQRSSVGEISITGKFTVENQKDAYIYLSTIHLLKALTKMRFGGATGGDADSGAPPPICRLSAFGPEMLNNVPIAITNVRVELPNDVDYFSVFNKNSEIGESSVPTVSTLAITCLPVYSRAEMQKFSVDRYLRKAYPSQTGYL